MNLDPTSFDDFTKLALPSHDISRFKDAFGYMLDINGAVPADVLGFHISLNEEGDLATNETDQAQDVFKTFAPAVVYVGSEELQRRLATLGQPSVVMPYFEDGGFAVVLKVPRLAELALVDLAPASAS